MKTKQSTSKRMRVKLPLLQPVEVDTDMQLAIRAFAEARVGSKVTHKTLFGGQLVCRNGKIRQVDNRGVVIEYEAYSSSSSAAASSTSRDTICLDFIAFKFDHMHERLKFPSDVEEAITEAEDQVSDTEH